MGAVIYVCIYVMGLNFHNFKCQFLKWCLDSCQNRRKFNTQFARTVNVLNASRLPGSVCECCALGENKLKSRQHLFSNYLLLS